jgi:hypothetical protein
MLSPSINQTNELMTQALNEIMQLDKNSNTAISIFIGKLTKDPDWLASVRNRIKMLSDAGVSWMNQKPELWSQILVQFINYSTNFASFAEQQSKGNLSTDEFVVLLKTLLRNQLKTAVSETTLAKEGIQSHQNQFKSIQPLLEASIQEGWQELADEEQQMVKIAAEMMHLQDLVSSLDEKISSGIISGNKSVISSSISTIYKLVTTTGSSFSFLSMATSAITVGKMYFDIISSTDKAAKALQEIAKLQVEASEEAQAAAATKIILQLLYSLEKSFLAMHEVLPQIITMWQTEQNKIESVIQAIEAGADPKTYFDILTVPTANANWQAISKFTEAIPTIIEDTGKPVILNPQNGKVTTTDS